MLNNVFPLIRSISRIPFLSGYFLQHYAQLRLRVFQVGKHIPCLHFPRYVHFLVTFNCNFFCKQCQVNAGEAGAQELSYQEITRVIQEIKDQGVKHLIITGGEPLVRKDIFDILRFANDVGIPKLTLATNGYLVENFKHELAALKIDKIVTSIDDTRHSNDELRGKKGAFEKAFQALDIFKEIGVPVREINTTVLPGTVQHMEELAKCIEGSAATHWVLGPLFPTGRAQSMKRHSFDDRELMELIHLVKRLRRSLPVELLSHTGYMQNYASVTSEPFYCRAGRECCSINPNGDVLPCNMISDPHFAQGNLREKDFKSIWQSGFHEFRVPHVPDECLSCEFLQACGGGCWGCRTINAKYCFKELCC